MGAAEVIRLGWKHYGTAPHRLQPQVAAQHLLQQGMGDTPPTPLLSSRWNVIKDVVQTADIRRG